MCVWKTPNNYLVTEDTFLSTMFSMLSTMFLQCIVLLCIEVGWGSLSASFVCSGSILCVLQYYAISMLCEPWLKPQMLCL